MPQPTLLLSYSLAFLLLLSGCASVEPTRKSYIPPVLPELRQNKTASFNKYPNSRFIWPAKGRVISKFGDKINNIVNKGLTLKVSPESDILAAQNGKVVFTASQLKGYGKTVILAHDNGIMTVYALLSDILVQTGESITRGSPIARSASGLLHFEIREGYISQNPYYYLNL